jgi:hypothetical protein
MKRSICCERDDDRRAVPAEAETSVRTPKHPAAPEFGLGTAGALQWRFTAG